MTRNSPRKKNCTLPTVNIYSELKPRMRNAPSTIVRAVRLGVLRMKTPICLPRSLVVGVDCRVPRWSCMDLHSPTMTKAGACNHHFIRRPHRTHGFVVVRYAFSTARPIVPTASVWIPCRGTVGIPRHCCDGIHRSMRRCGCTIYASLEGLLRNSGAGLPTARLVRSRGCPLEAARSRPRAGGTALRLPCPDWSQPGSPMMRYIGTMRRRGSGLGWRSGRDGRRGRP